MHSRQSSSLLRRTVVNPLLRLLRHGATPRRLAWSVAAGFVIGINPLIGSTTVLALLAAHLFKLNYTASQIGTHSAYPVELLLLLPFLRAGTWLFRTAPLPFRKDALLTLVRQHPLRLVRILWTWEWHALVVWAMMAAPLIPALAFVLRHIFERLMRQPREAVAG